MKKHSGCLILRFSAVGIIKREALTLGREGFPPPLLFDALCYHWFNSK